MAAMQIVSGEESPSPDGPPNVGEAADIWKKDGRRLFQPSGWLFGANTVAAQSIPLNSIWPNRIRQGREPIFSAKMIQTSPCLSASRPDYKSTSTEVLADP